MKRLGPILKNIFSVVLACFWCSQIMAQTISEQDINKQVVMEFMETYNTTERRSAEQAYLSLDHERIRSEFHHLRHHALSSELMTKAEPLRLSITNRRDVVDLVLAEADTVAVRYRIYGEHSGNLYGITATQKVFEIDASALFWLKDGKITKSWFMADEAGLLKAIGQTLPKRKDGRFIAGPNSLPMNTGDAHLAELLENPIDSQTFRNKLVINAYKSKNPPQGILPPREEYGLALRRGFTNLASSTSPEMLEKHSFRDAFPDREDMIVKIIADGDWVVILLRITATNTDSLFGMPALGQKVSVNEFGFMEFDGEEWKHRWFFGDELGMLLQIGGPQDYWFSGGQ